MRLLWSFVALTVTRGSPPCAELAHRESPGCVVMYDSRLADAGLATAARNVSEALRAFSVETVVAYPSKDATSKEVAVGLEGVTSFLAALA